MRQARIEDHHEQGPLHKALHQQDILDHETGQTGIPIVGDYSHSSAHHSRHISPAVEDYDGTQHTTKPKSVVRIGGQETNLCIAQTVPAASMVRRPMKDQNVSPHSFGGLVIPPVAPPPPPPTVSHSSTLPTATTTHPRTSARKGSTVVGTVQFAIPNSNTSGNVESQVSRASSNTALVPIDVSGITDRSSVAATSMMHPDPPMECCPSSEDRQQLMDEIATVGQSILRRTGRPKSPGGTPIKHTRNRLTLTGNTDMLQRALISKFRSLHSTPIRHQSPAGVDKSGSLDLSNAWSDINGSSTAYEDPDLSSTPPSALAPPSNRSSSSRLLDNNMADPNSSTAV